MPNAYSVDLPAGLRRFLEAEAKRRGYESAGAYVEARVYAAADVPDDDAFAAKLLEGLASPKRIEATRAYWARKRRTLVARHAPAPRR